MTVDAEAIRQRSLKAEEICRERGVLFTGLRRQILSFLLDVDRPLGAYELLERLKEGRPKAAPPTIYRALEFLRAHGLIHRVERLNAFVACVDASQRHPVQLLICRVCGRVDEMHEPRIMAAMEEAAGIRGFRPSDATVEVEGVCGRCACHQACPPPAVPEVPS
jgi:Fur family transcriptional regulator, zinc uptake regulator